MGSRGGGHGAKRGGPRGAVGEGQDHLPFGGAAPGIFWLGWDAFCLAGPGFFSLPLVSFMEASFCLRVALR